MKLATLGGFVKIRTGKLDANASSSNGEYKFFTCAIQPLKINSYSYDCECVLVAGNGDLNVKYYDGKFDAYQRTYIIESNDNSALDVRYLFHFMSKYVETLRKGSIGGVIKYIKLGHLTEAKIPLPPLEEQRRIAAILDKADAIRKKRKKAIELTETFLRSVFLDMFGDPVTNPMGWPISALGNHLDFITSGSRGWAKYYSSTGARFIRSLDVQMNRLTTEDIAFVQPPNSAESVRTRVKPKDVLLTITGSRIGRVTAVPNDVGEAYISQHVAILRVNGSMEPRFLSMYLSNALGGQRQIVSMQYGQTKPGLNLEQIRNFSIPVPPKSKQREFCSIWDKINLMDTHLNDSSVLSNNQFSALVQKSFMGELIQEAEEQAVVEV